MDNTLVDWERQFERLMNMHYPQIPIVPPMNRTEFKIEMNYDDEYRDPILHLTSLDEFWLSMDPTEGALAALEEMSAIGMIVFIVTTPDAKHTARSACEKITWIERHLGKEWKAKTVLAHDKTLVKDMTCPTPGEIVQRSLVSSVGDILIDDKPSASVGLLRPSWTHMLFAQPYNIHAHMCPRLDNWAEWGPTLYAVLLEREKQRQEMVALWDVEVGEDVEKKMSDMSDGLRHVRSPLRRPSRHDCCGPSKFGSSVTKFFSSQ